MRVAVAPGVWSWPACVLGAILAGACGDDASARDADGATATDAATDDAGRTADGGATGSGIPLADVTCDTKPPRGAPKPPPPPAYSGGMCPKLVIGRNTIKTATGDREFVLVGPKTIDPKKPLPLTFMWAWLAGDADQFVTIGMLEALTEKYHFLAAVPDPGKDVSFNWPFHLLATDARRDQEFVLFDDILACVSEQFPVNAGCVSSVGVSAGALFTSLLIGGRGDYLASAIVLSGGVGGIIKPWIVPEHKLPVFVLWGGATDQCFGILNFQATTATLETALMDGNHFVVECTHNCGHAVPPFDTGSPVEPVIDFVLKHPYWLAPGESPYNESGLPDVYPDWCAIGVGNAVPREGECPAGFACPPDFPTTPPPAM